MMCARLRQGGWFVAAALACGPVVAAQPHVLIDNFTAAPPSNRSVTAEADFTQPKVGLAAARLSYRIDPASRAATLEFPDAGRSLGSFGPGRVVLWVKGDGSGNELELVVRHARISLDAAGNRQINDQADLALPRIRLDFTDWKEVTLDAPGLPSGPGRTAWWQRINLVAAAADPAVEGEQARLEGDILLDDARFYPNAGTPGPVAVATLIGPPVRGYTTGFAYALDLRRFGGDPAAPPAVVKTRIAMTDRNENLVADRDFATDLAADEGKEVLLDVAPENLSIYLPPFRLSGDVLSSELPELPSVRIDATVVMGNALAVFEDFSEVSGRWFAYGYDGSLRNVHEWINWTHGEYQRCTVTAQSTARISRVDLGPVPATVAVNAPAARPPTRHAMRVEFTGDAAVYSGLDRYLPGNPYRLGVWIKGDPRNAGAILSVLTMDYTDGADFWIGGWRRITNGERPLGPIDFEGWKYLEVDLPGNGQGVNSPKGSSDALDFPLEVTAFRIQSDNPASGSIEIGPIIVHTQVQQAATLNAFIAWDDPDHVYAADRGATVTVANAWRLGDRTVRCNWTLLDRAGDVIGSGRQDLSIPAEQAREFRVDLAALKEKVAASRGGPLTLQVSAADAADGSISVSRAISLALPDSATQLTGFEAQRGYLGLKANGVPRSPRDGEPAAAVSDAQAAEGKRSLALTWSESAPKVVVSIDPPLPGVPTELSMKVHGDGSGARFYPIVGDRRGVNKGTPNGQWDFFLPQVIDGATSGGGGGVTVDWMGWRELRFRLPVIPPTWDQNLPVLQFTPSYPLGLHLVAEKGGSDAAGGTIFIDDVRVVTHLPADERVDMTFDRSGETNVVSPGSDARVLLVNRDAVAERAVKVAGSVTDWRGRVIGGVDQAVSLAPGEVRAVTVAAGLPGGAYLLRVRMDLAGGAADARPQAWVEEDLLVADLAEPLGPDVPAAMRDEWKLRPAIRETFAYIDEDWDWVEFHPGNLQTQTLRSRLRRAIDQGAAPFELLGFSAYWSSGVGLEQVKAGSFVRPVRHRGAAVDMFQVPGRIEDWDHYVMETIRGAGDLAAGWVIWDNPGAEGPLAVPPDKFAAMLASADAWRKEYTPDKPLIIGGMSRASVVPYLTLLAEHNALQHVGGVNIRLDVGRLSPEDAQVEHYVRQVRSALEPGAGQPAKLVLLSDLDWAVETSDSGLNGFDQAAYLARADLILHRHGIRPVVAIRNEDFDRMGTGLIYRRVLEAPPLIEKPLAYQIKPGWWALSRTRGWLERLEFVGDVEVCDVVPGRTVCQLYRRKSDGRATVILWRNDDAGAVSFEAAGVTVEAAEDMLGAPVVAENGWHAVGKMPVVFTLAGDGASLGLLRVRDGDAPAWPQRVVSVIDAAKPQAWSGVGGQAASFVGKSAYFPEATMDGVKFASGGSEAFTVAVPQGSGVILRKRYFLDEMGHESVVTVNGAEAGRWDLRRTDARLSSGIREAIFVIEPAALAGQAGARIELRYPEGRPANTIGWVIHEYRPESDAAFPLTAVGPIHADQNVGQPRPARNITGGGLAVGAERFTAGIGVFAQSLLEYPLNGQFKTFTAKVGVDAVTDGKGSVVFEVYADGKKVWNSGIMSGLDAARDVSIDVTGVNRLRLVVTDAGDGNRFDAADWIDPALGR